MSQIFTDRRCLEHRSPSGFPERPSRLADLLSHLRERGHPVVESTAGKGDEAAARAVHEPRYVDRFRRAVERGDGLIDSADNPLSEGTWRAALGAVAAVAAATDCMMQSPGEAVFAAVRPPGHHAERATAMGFCYFNNVAAAAERLRRRHDLDRVAIFDFDVHHGNGTQHLFEERGDVLYASIHQYPFYPGTGSAAERGRGAGAGATVNVPLPAGSGDEAYLEAITGRILPALEAFAPQALLLSAGFDAWRGDPLGGMRVSQEAYAEWGRRLGALARRLCGGRVLAVLEGGYDTAALPRLVDVHLAGLTEGLGS